MADQSSFPSPNSTQNHKNKPISSLVSPRFFNSFLTRSLSDTETTKTTVNTYQFQTSRDRLYDFETITSPNSILDSMHNFNLGNPFGYDRTSSKPITKKPSNNKMESESIGLALIDSKEISSVSKALFGAKLKVEIPCSSTESLEVKKISSGDFGEGLSLTEMESSEDYTCVISHGPNPKTTHIFDNCIVESCCGVRKLSELTKENGFLGGDSNSCLPEKILSCCNSCKVDHTECKDIYMGEKDLTCSHECQEMILEGQGQESTNER
ncbi:FCS-Like Zinc finger 8-like [Nicotiana tabacum]|uniref:FCS-Like Zinc finger 8-like n=2 Tax=Nicotiana tabacum TaxID=4097 RepID=A0AC58SYC7_TOBAC